MIVKPITHERDYCEDEGCDQHADVFVFFSVDGYRLCDRHAREVCRRIIAVLSPNTNAGQLDYGVEGNNRHRDEQRRADRRQDEIEQTRVAGYVPPSADAAKAND